MEEASITNVIIPSLSDASTINLEFQVTSVPVVVMAFLIELLSDEILIIGVLTDKS